MSYEAIHENKTSVGVLDNTKKMQYNAASNLNFEVYVLTYCFNRILPLTLSATYLN